VCIVSANSDAHFNYIVEAAYEAERHDAAMQFVEQFRRGVLTVEDLRNKLNDVLDGIRPSI